MTSKVSPTKEDQELISNVIDLLTLLGISEGDTTMNYEDLDAFLSKEELGAEFEDEFSPGKKSRRGSEDSIDTKVSIKSQLGHAVKSALDKTREGKKVISTDKYKVENVVEILTAILRSDTEQSISYELAAPKKKA